MPGVATCAARPTPDRAAVESEAEEAGRRAAADVAVHLQGSAVGRRRRPVDDAPGDGPRRGRGLSDRGAPAGRRAPVVRGPLRRGPVPRRRLRAHPGFARSASTPSWAEPARAWGAAKAMAHKARHGTVRP